ncbi:leucyl aminopeptidase [Oscillatoria amoena NRMC-F 0135]|nr:leucyl aminopeptidase [Oscillatoria amoena NRMC-F 0135]MDL5053588.1 leucyl aminopeptidase [Oscillatoria laete-virens NRMC-F 0139]
MIDFLIKPSAQPDSSIPLIGFIPEYSAKSPVPELASVSREEFSGKKLSHILLRDGKKRFLFVGLGESAKIDGDVIRKAAGTAIRLLIKNGFSRAQFALTGYESHAQACVEGILHGEYEFNDFKAVERKNRTHFLQATLLTSKTHLTAVTQAVQSGRVIGECTNVVRQIGNLPGNYINPPTLAAEATKLAAKYKLKATVFDRKKLEAGGFRGILAVGAGSKSEPRLIVLEYNGAKSKSSPPLALVGKAITFDSGGISIKPWERMEEMKFDKMGGVAVLGAICAIAALKLPVNVVALISSAENLLDAHSYRPGDIITSYDGKTIEVLTTDAEGRIVLADAMAYAREKFKPAAMIDLATLTGACIVALGEHKAGLFGNDEEFIGKVRAASLHSAEPAWHLPLGPEYHDMIKSDVATVKNVGGRYGGAITAAAFLELWAGKTPWVHLDIAGVAWTTRDHAWQSKGATGYGVRLLVDLAEQFAR